MANPLYDITLGLSIDQAQLTREIQKQDQALKKLYAEAMAHGVDAGMGFFKRGGLQKEFKKAGMEMHSIQTKLHQLGRKERQQGLKDEERALKERLKLRRKALKDEGRERVKQMKEAAKIEAQYREKAAKAAARRKAVGDAFGKGEKGVQGGMGDFLKALKGGDVAGLARSGGVMAGQAGQMAGAIGKKMGGTGIGKSLSKMFGPMVRMLAPLAKMLPMIGMIAGGFIALVKVILDAEAVTKGFRKQLIRTGGSALDFERNVQGVKRSVDDLANSFGGLGEGLSFQYEFGVNTEEALKALNALRDQGIAINDIIAGTSTLEGQQKALRKAVGKTLELSLLLGYEYTEMAQKVGEMATNLNMSLGTVGDQFSELATLAQTSGYATKKFFGQVLQLTAGQSMYNVRLGETAALLSDLQKSLGAKDGFDLLQKILGTMSGKDMKTSIKEQVIRGNLGKEKDQALKVLESMAATMLQNPNFKAGILGASAKSGVEVDASSPKALRDSLRKLNKEDRQKLIGAYEQNAQGNKEMMKGFSAFQDYLQAVQAGKGGGLEGRASLAAFQGKLGPSFAMMQQLGILKKARKMGGGEGRSRLLAESFGLDVKQANDLSKYIDMLEGRFKTMAADAKRLKGTEYSEEQQKQDLERYGMAYARGDDGTITGGLVGRNGQEINNIDDAIISNAEGFQKMIDPEKATEQVILARQIAASTTDMTKILGSLSEGILTNIYKSIEKIYRFIFGKSTGERMNLAQDRVSSFYEAKIKTREDEIAELNKQEAANQKLLKTDKTMSPAEKAARLDQIAEGRARKDELRQEISGLRDKKHKAGMAMAQIGTSGASDVFEYFQGAEGDVDKLSGAVRQIAEGNLTLKELKELDGEQYTTNEVIETRPSYKEGVPSTYVRYDRQYAYHDFSEEDANKKVQEDSLDVQKKTEESTEKSTKNLGKIEDSSKKTAKALEDLNRRTFERDVNQAIGQAASVGTKLAGSNTVGNLIEQINSKAAKQFFSKAAGDPAEGTEGFEVKKIVQSLLRNRDLAQPIRTQLTKYTGINDGIAHLQEVGGEMRMRIQRINPEDVVSVHKGHQRSGPMSGSGGGTQVVNNNFWEGKGAFNSLAAYERAKGAYS